MKKVLVFGTFDILHPGHLYFLRAAKKYGNHLTVIVTRDKRLGAEKNHPAVFNQKERMAILKSLKMVNRVILGDPAFKWSAVRRLKPGVICLGHDQKGNHPQFLAQLKWLKKKPKIIKIGAFQPLRYGSSKIKSKMRG